MKPRIVRPNSTERAGDEMLHECFSGRTIYLALPWPKDCPYTPEQVMAACERAGNVPLSVPMKNTLDDWVVVIGFLHWRNLTPEFMGEPKKCEHPDGMCFTLHAIHGGWFIKCDACGAILSDRRHGERREGERRGRGSWGGRRDMDTVRGTNADRRIGTDRRKS